MTLSAHLSNFVILLQCVLDVWLLDTRITEKTGGASGLGRGEGRGGRSRKNSKSGSRNRDKKERVTRERRREGRKGERWEGGGRGREGGREGEREREREAGLGGRGREASSLFFLFFPSLLFCPWRCNPLSRQPQLSPHPLVQLHSSYDSVSGQSTKRTVVQCVHAPQRVQCRYCLLHANDGQ